MQIILNTPEEINDYLQFLAGKVPAAANSIDKPVKEAEQPQQLAAAPPINPRVPSQDYVARIKQVIADKRAEIEGEKDSMSYNNYHRMLNAKIEEIAKSINPDIKKVSELADNATHAETFILRMIAVGLDAEKKNVIENLPF